MRLRILFRHHGPAGAPLLRLAFAALLCGFGATDAAAAEPQGRGLVIAIQQRLAVHGFDPGRPDGVAGRKTRDAIRGFEQRSGLKETGEPSVSLYRRLLADPPAASPGGAALPPTIRSAAGRLTPAGPEAAAPPAGRAAGLAGTTWRFSDDNGAVFTATFDPGGKLSGTTASSDWEWQQNGDAILLRYGNALGESTVREGRLVAPGDLAGTGRSSRGARWAWTAVRVQ